MILVRVSACLGVVIVLGLMVILAASTRL